MQKKQKEQIISDITKLNKIDLTKLLKNKRLHENGEENEESEIESGSASDSEQKPPPAKTKQKENKEQRNGLYK